MGFEDTLMNPGQEAGAWAKLDDMSDPLSTSIKARYSPEQVGILDQYVFNFVPPIENIFPDVSEEDRKELLGLMTDYLETYKTIVGANKEDSKKVNDPTLKQKAQAIINKIDSL